MSNATTALRGKEKAPAAALVEMCTVRLGSSIFGVPITHILEMLARRGRSRFRWRQIFVGGWCTIAAMC